jgi:hypothetical protein
MSSFKQGPFTQFVKHQHVEEMHAAEYQDNGPHFDAQLLYQLPYVQDIIRNAERIHGIADVHEIKSDQQQVVDGIRQLLVAMEDVDKKDLSVAEQCPGYPDSKNERKDEIDGVADKNVRHKVILW